MIALYPKEESREFKDFLSHFKGREDLDDNQARYLAIVYYMISYRLNHSDFTEIAVLEELGVRK